MNETFLTVAPNLNDIDKRIVKITELLRNFSPELQIFSTGIEHGLREVCKWELFTNMTGVQFDSFLNYLKEINSAKIFITFGKNYKEKEQLSWLKIITLCAVFPNFMNTSLTCAIKKSMINCIAPPQDIFTELFDKYEISNDFFISTSEMENYIFDKFEHYFFDGSRNNNSSHQELDIYAKYTDFYMLLAIKNGFNIRTVNTTHFRISKKESFYFHHQLNLIKIDKAECYIKQRIVASKLAIVAQNNFRALQTFLTSSNTFRNHIDIYYAHILFWKRALIILISSNYQEYEIKTYVDFLEIQLQFNQNYNLKGRTLRSIQDQMQNWHESITYEQLDGDPIRWGTKEDSITKTIIYQNQTYQYKQITDSFELYLEGKKNHHCVYTYLPQCIEKQIEIWKLYDPDSKKRITIEVRNQKIIQALGIFNQPDTFLEDKILPILAERENFMID